MVDNVPFWKIEISSKVCYWQMKLWMKKKRKKKECMLFKVDFEKAHDSISWEFLWYMLHRLGFEGKWVGWMKACLRYSTMLVLVNGSPTSEFGMKKRLRQGYPLVPFLFTIVAEGLCALMR